MRAAQGEVGVAAGSASPTITASPVPSARHEWQAEDRFADLPDRGRSADPYPPQRCSPGRRGRPPLGAGGPPRHDAEGRRRRRGGQCPRPPAPQRTGRLLDVDAALAPVRGGEAEEDGATPSSWRRAWGLLLRSGGPSRSHAVSLGGNLDAPCCVRPTAPLPPLLRRQETSSHHRKLEIDAGVRRARHARRRTRPVSAPTVVNFDAVDRRFQGGQLLSLWPVHRPRATSHPRQHPAYYQRRPRPGSRPARRRARRSRRAGRRSGARPISSAGSHRGLTTVAGLAQLAERFPLIGLPTRAGRHCWTQRPADCASTRPYPPKTPRPYKPDPSGLPVGRHRLRRPPSGS